MKEEGGIGAGEMNKRIPVSIDDPMSKTGGTRRSQLAVVQLRLQKAPMADQGAGVTILRDVATIGLDHATRKEDMTDRGKIMALEALDRANINQRQICDRQRSTMRIRTL